MRTTFAFAIFVLLAADIAAADRPAKVLLITDDTLAEAWQPFADWKTRQGKPAKIVTVDAIKQRYRGDDVQQQIRACVLDHIDNHGTKWVVIGGDSGPDGGGIVPDRDTRHRQFRYADIPTDLYYISDQSWDANDDGIYGDWNDDRAAISYSHGGACIGRIPLRTVDDVMAYTNKVIAYESRYPTAGFATRLVYTCPESVAYPKLNTSRKAIAAKWNAGELSQFFGNKTPWDRDKPGDYDLSPANWAKLVNDQATGKMHIHGHGLLPVWVLEGNRTVDKDTISTLKNDTAFPVITTVSCFTGHFDAKQDPSITEMMLRRPQAGAIAIVAPSREGVPVFADRRDFRKMITEGKMDGTTRLLTDFWSQALEKDLTAGEALAAAKANMADDAAGHAGYHWCLCELNLLGDPTLDLRSAAPKLPEVKFVAGIRPGKQQYRVHTDTPGATICLWQGDAVYEVATAGGSGEAEFTIDPRSGEILLTVSGANLNTFAASVKVSR